MKTIIYVRQSEDKAGHEAAVQRQESACRLLASAKGWETPEVYADNSISATTGKTRPEFERLLRDIQAGTVGQLVVWHLDRLTRSMKDLTRIVEAGQKQRVNIACVHGVSLDLGDPTGVAVAQILTAIAAMETGHKGNRQKAANRQRAEAGEAFWSRRPFGYDRDDDGKVHVVPTEAEAIQEAARLVLEEGATLASIARQWNEAGHRTTTKERGLWGVTQVRRVLLNPRNTGARLYNGEQMLTAGKWDAIIDVDTFEQLESKLNDPRRRTAPDDLNTKYLLSGLVKCGKCGNSMFAAPTKVGGRQVMVYRCFGGYCMQRRKDLVDGVVLDTVLARLAMPDAVGALSQGVDVAALHTKAKELRGRRDALAALLADGLLSPAAVRAQAGKISSELVGVEAAISAAEGRNPAAALIGSPDIAAAWDALPLGNQRQIIRGLVDITILPAGKGIRFSDDQVKIDWKR